jgi:hypothetical protein
MIDFLLRNTEADILVYKTQQLGALASFDFDFCNADGVLNGYSVKKHKNIPNNAYLLSRGSFGNYDAVYHIFLNSFIKFNKSFPQFPEDKQIVHLYPGGGYNFSKVNFPKKTKIISTHPETTELYKNYDTIECLFGVQAKERSQIKSKDFTKKEQLNICFSSIGNPVFKGDDTYLKVAEEYNKKFPNDKVKFMSVGNCLMNPLIEHHEAMDYISLGNFYRENVDIYVSAETGISVNGWPLGLEAAVTGSVLLTTDSRNTAEKLNIKDPSILTCRNVSDFVSTIRKLYLDREYANLCSSNTQLLLLENVSPEYQQEKILKFIKGN